ncbi:MAG TPA: hypothetical protein VF648_09290 [Pyrinomonadaceae bacterium]|jgi:hypothetical protein
MENPNHNEEVRRHQRLLELYVEGLDERNDSKIAFVLEAALNDAELDYRLDEINMAFVEEIGLSDLGELPNIVREQIRESFPSTFEQDQSFKPLTVGDVAKQLEISRTVPSGDEAVNRQLLDDQTALPKKMSLNEIKRLANELKISASNYFWRRFHGAAMALRAERSQEMALFATRQKRLKKQHKEAEESDERRKETRD